MAQAQAQKTFSPTRFKEREDSRPRGPQFLDEPRDQSSMSLAERPSTWNNTSEERAEDANEETLRTAPYPDSQMHGSAGIDGSEASTTSQGNRHAIIGDRNNARSVGRGHLAGIKGKGNTSEQYDTHPPTLDKNVIMLVIVIAAILIGWLVSFRSS